MIMAEPRDVQVRTAYITEMQEDYIDEVKNGRGDKADGTWTRKPLPYEACVPYVYVYLNIT